MSWIIDLFTCYCNILAESSYRIPTPSRVELNRQLCSLWIPLVTQWNAYEHHLSNIELVNTEAEMEIVAESQSVFHGLFSQIYFARVGTCCVCVDLISKRTKVYRCIDISFTKYMYWCLITNHQVINNEPKNGKRSTRWNILLFLRFKGGTRKKQHGWNTLPLQPEQYSISLQ